MGGMKPAGISIECDRTKKEEAVHDAELVKFYEEFADKAKKKEVMFAAVLHTPDGVRKISYDWLSPSSINTVSGYLDKIEPPKKRGKKKNGDGDKKTEGDKKGEEEKADADEPDRDAGVDEEGNPAPEEDFNEDDLVGDDDAGEGDGDDMEWDD